ncbi:hypothetical protein ACRALDRAFT_205025 [Sodiomyces alcalophilus JCM 7366]|uniref:uncharacterized protein n=1 Tax=Sodiomyces alcalophilus JCM 7366 TaxID=591952 RepID=UPI0039B6942F
MSPPFPFNKIRELTDFWYLQRTLYGLRRTVPSHFHLPSCEHPRCRTETPPTDLLFDNTVGMHCQYAWDLFQCVRVVVQSLSKDSEDIEQSTPPPPLQRISVGTRSMMLRKLLRTCFLLSIAYPALHHFASCSHTNAAPWQCSIPRRKKLRAHPVLITQLPASSRPMPGPFLLRTKTSRIGKLRNRTAKIPAPVYSYLGYSLPNASDWGSSPAGGREREAWHAATADNKPYQMHDTNVEAAREPARHTAAILQWQLGAELRILFDWNDSKGLLPEEKGIQQTSMSKRYRCAGCVRAQKIDPGARWRWRKISEAGILGKQAAATFEVGQALQDPAVHLTLVSAGRRWHSSPNPGSRRRAQGQGVDENLQCWQIFGCTCVNPLQHMYIYICTSEVEECAVRQNGESWKCRHSPLRPKSLSCYSEPPEEAQVRASKTSSSDGVYLDLCVGKCWGPEICAKSTQMSKKCTPPTSRYICLIAIL